MAFILPILLSTILPKHRLFLTKANKNSVVKDSKKIALLVNQKDLKIIEFSSKAREVFDLNRLKKKNLFLKDIIQSKKLLDQIKRISDSSTKKKF